MEIHRCRFVDYTPHTITSLAFSSAPSLAGPAPKDLRLAVGRSNGQIEIWNPRNNWTHELTLAGSKGRSVEGLRWVGARLFSIGGSTYITEWDLVKGQPLVNYDCNAGVIWSVANSASGDKLAVGCDDGSVVVVDISGGLGSLEYDIICQRQDARVLSLEWNKDGQIIGGCADGRIRVWSYCEETKGRILSTMRVDKSRTESTLVWSVQVLSDKQQLITGDSTGHVKIWDLKFFTLIQSLKIHDADVLCIVANSKEDKFFTAGIDRKIHQFDLLKTKNSSKWVHSQNRLLHSNDIRSLAIYESKNLNILVSGGVERSIIVQSIEQFHDGNYKKLLLDQQQSNVVVDEESRMIAMWQDQTVKVWIILQSGKHKLIAKLTLSDDENITSVDLKGNILAVSRMTSVKVFELVEQASEKYAIEKIRDSNFDSLISGAKIVKLLQDYKLLVLTPEEELYMFTIDLSESKVNLDEEIELIEAESNASVPHQNCINHLTCTPDSSQIVISRTNGSIEIYPLGGEEAYILTKTMSAYPHLIACHGNEKLLVLTDENKLYEFNIAKSAQLLTNWTRRNSEFLPKRFTNLEDKPQGLFCKDSKAWIYGTTWLCYFDMSKNVPISELHKNINTKNRKRNRNGLTITGGDDSNGNSADAQQLEYSLKQSEVDKMKKQIIEEGEEEGGQDEDMNDDSPEKKQQHQQQQSSFWITEKYRPILKVASFGTNGLVVVERPYFALPTTPAFNLPKFRV
ncbi:uncharacterized protein LODBEIA_P34450 [Lodderomyces beijingensis]|uniref:Anaphase-promoting complex subunit 4 WD40 domain-containing protein n=1 Tax=Lodderomyces beijingensis TaxID=1775926 RepID=A0ABP0ZM34_9ASCO